MEKVNLHGYFEPVLFNIKYKLNKSGDDIFEAIILAYDLEDAISGFYNKISKEKVSTILSIANLSENTDFMYTKTGYDSLVGKEWYIYDMRIDKEIIKDFEYKEKDTIKEEFNKYLDGLRYNIKNSIKGFCATRIKEPVINNEEFYFSKWVAEETFEPILFIQKRTKDIDNSRYNVQTYKVNMSKYTGNFTSTNYIDFRTEIMSSAEETKTEEIFSTPLYSLYIFS